MKTFSNKPTNHIILKNLSNSPTGHYKSCGIRVYTSIGVLP